MKISPLIIVCLIAFICQIAFSIYFSIAIVDQNTLINNQQSELSDLELVNQKLANQLAENNALNKIENASDSSSLSPIKQSLDLR